METNNELLENENELNTLTDDRKEMPAMDPSTSNSNVDADSKGILDIAASSLIETVDESKDDDTDIAVSEDNEGGIDDEMKAMFGEDPSTSPGVVSNDEASRVAEAMPPSDEGDKEGGSKPADNDGEKPELDQTPDESNLEDMMEALHADKVAKSPPSIQKQNETSGLELQDVLQALTGDLEESPTDINKGSERKRKIDEKKIDPKSRKAQILKEDNAPESSESDGSADHATIKRLRDRRGLSTRAKEPQKAVSEGGRGRKMGSKKSDLKGQNEGKDNSDSEENNKGSSDDEKDVRKTRTRSAKKNEPDESDRDSDSETDATPSRKSRSISRTLRKQPSGPVMISKSKKVCILADCRQQCFPQLGISLHRFPLANHPMREFWLRLVKMDVPGPITAFICSKHFTEKDYSYDATKEPTDTFYRKLKCNATPSIGLPVSAQVINQVRAEVDRTFADKSSGESKKRSIKIQEKTGAKGKSEPQDSDGDASVGSETDRRSLRSTGKALPTKSNEEAKRAGAGLKSKLDKNKRGIISRSPSPSKSSTSIQQPSIKTPVVRRKMESETKARTPGTNCSVPCCGNNLFETRAEGYNISYYRFPFDSVLADKWIKKIGEPNLVARTARICSDHFGDKDFEGTSGGKRNLKPKAVPSLYLVQKKLRDDDSDDYSDQDEKPTNKKKFKRKTDGDSKKEDKPSKKGKPDTSFITMPLPIIEDVEIKSEPPSDNEVVGQDYAVSDPGSDDDYAPSKNDNSNKSKVSMRNDDEPSVKVEKDVEVKRGRGRPPTKNVPQMVKPVSLVSLALPIVSLERLGKRVIDAADSGSLRVRIKESSEAAKRPPPKYKPGPKSMRKRPAESDDDVQSANDEGKSGKSPLLSKPGPLSKKKKMLEKSSVAPKRQPRKVLKMSDSESESDPDIPPDPPSTSAQKDLTSAPPITFAKSPNPVKVKLGEQPKSILDRTVTDGSLADLDQCVNDLLEDPTQDLESILSSAKPDKDRIIQLVEQRISEHTKIIEGKTMGPQQLADHNKILQGSALVLKKLAEKSGKTLPLTQIIPLNIPDNASITPGRTIVLKKVADPSKLGLKPPESLRSTISKTDSSPSSPSKTPLAVVSPQSSARSTPVKLTNNVKPTIHSDDASLKNEPKPSTSLEKIRDYDNLMKRYLSAVLVKNVMSKKYSESKEAQKTLELKLQERTKEVEVMKRKVNSLQAKVNRINSALEYFLTPNQIKLALQETKKVAWSPEEMLTAFTIKHLSKACYLFLRHKLNYPLPGISSLQRWMTMLSKDKVEDDEDNIADEDMSDKEENQEILEEGPGVVNEITGTLEEINACGAPGEEAFNANAEEGSEQIKDSNQSSPFQVVFENDTNSNSNRKVIILKKMPKVSGKMKVKNKLQINASENDVNVSNIEENEDRNEIYRLLPGAKTISMGSSPSAPQKKTKYITSKKLKEKEKISFHRLPHVRPDLSKPPRIQIVKNEPKDEFVGQFIESHPDEHIMQVDSELVSTETIIKPEGIMHIDVPHQEGESPQKFYTISDLNSSQMEEHIVENVEHMTEDGQIVEKADHEMLIEGEGMESITIVKEGDVVEHHPGGEGSGIEDIVNMAAEQQITFATTEDMSRAHHHFAQIAYTQGNTGEITLHEDINNMTAVVINDIDEEQLNTLLLSNVVEQKHVGMEGEQAYGPKKIVYQTIDNDKNVIVLQPDSQAFIEEDEGTSSGAPRVYIINQDGNIVSASDGEVSALAQEIGYIDSDAFSELGYKLSSDPDQAFTISNLIDNYAITSPQKSFRKHS